MKAGKSKKNSAVPSSADKKRLAPSKTKSAGVKAASAKLSSPKKAVEVARLTARRMAKDKGEVRKRRTELAATKPERVLRSKEPKKKQLATPTAPMPAAIVKSAFKEETSTPGISPAAILAEPAPGVSPVVAATPVKP